MAVGVPTALGKGASSRNRQRRCPPSSDFRANELATLVQSGESALTGYRDPYRDAFERTDVAGHQPGVATYRDAFERRHVTRTGLESSVGSYRDAFERANPSNVPVATSPVSSGTEIEWPQIGVGLGLGIMLALGLWLAMRITRIRPLAH